MERLLSSLCRTPSAAAAADATAADAAAADDAEAAAELTGPFENDCAPTIFDSSRPSCRVSMATTVAKHLPSTASD